MKKAIFMAAALLCAVLSSCTKEIEQPSSPNDIKFNISVADVNPATKALKQDWAAGDKLYVWFMFDQQQEPDLVMTYDGAKWKTGTLRSGITAEALAEACDDYENTVICYYEGFNDLNKYSYELVDDYGLLSHTTTLGGTAYTQMPMVLYGESVYEFDTDTNTLTATLGKVVDYSGGWKYITDLQVVVTGLSGDAGKYTLGCDKLIGPMYFNLGGGFDPEIRTVAGVSNADGAAFYFTFDTTGQQDYTFTLTDYTDESNPVVKTYTAAGKTLDSDGRAKCIGIKIDGSKFAASASTTTGTTGGHDWVQLWENGPYWATTNIGAETPEEYGYYFAWGYAEGCVRNSAGDGWVLASDGATAKEFDETYFPYRSESEFQDAATANWGSDWRMPTDAELETLINDDSSNKCTVEYVTTGTKGIKITGTDSYSANSIFLPAAGFGLGFYLGQAGDIGYYWASTQFDSSYADYLDLDPSRNDSCVLDDDNYRGFPVRPVRSSL